MFTIKINPPPNLNEIAQRLAGIPGGMEKAAQNAISRTLKGGRQDASRKIAQRYTIKTQLVIDTIRTRVSGLSGEMKSRGSRNPLDKFFHRPTQRYDPPPPGGVYAQVVRGQGGQLRHAWLMRSGGIYERIGKSRFPITRLHSASAPGMLAVPPVSKDIVAKMEQRIAINLEHAASAVIGGYL